MANRKRPDFPKLNHRYLRRLIDQNFDVVRERTTDDEVVILCPEAGCPDKSGNRSIHLKRNLTNCWRCRDKSFNGHVVPFLKRHDIDFETESVEELISSNPLDELDKEIDGKEVPQNLEITLPDHFTLLADDPDCIYSRLIAEMAQRKHLYLADFIEAGVGFTRRGEWEPFAIFPVYELGRLVYYQGRTYAKRFEGGSTKKFPSKKEMPYGAGYWVYGYDRIIQNSTKVIIVVESILNVLSLRWHMRCLGVSGIEPVAVFKHKISAPQVKKLLVSPAEEICIMYDGDATSDAWEEAKNLSGHRKSTVAKMPVGTDANDDTALAWQRFQERSSYSPANALEDLLL